MRRFGFGRVSPTPVRSRCHYIAKIGVDSCGFQGTPGDGLGDPKWMNRKGLLPEVSRNHHVRKTALIEFDSRRLHHCEVVEPGSGSFQRIRALRTS